MRIFATILAGGGGQRLGGVDKAGIRMHGKTLMDHLLTQLSGQADQIALSAGQLSTSRQQTDVAHLTDPFEPQIGPLGGIYAGYQWANGLIEDASAAALLVAPVDTPYFPTDFCKYAKPLLSSHDVVVARYNDQEYPTCSLWRLSAAENIASSRGESTNNSIRNYLDGLNATHLDFASFCANDPFKNANKMSDLLKLDQ